MMPSLSMAFVDDDTKAFTLLVFETSSDNTPEVHCHQEWHCELARLFIAQLFSRLYLCNLAISAREVLFDGTTVPSP